MAIIPDQLPGLVAQLSALVNSAHEGSPPYEAMHDIAEKILYATRPHMLDPMQRVFPSVDLAVLRLFIDWNVLDAIPLHGAIAYKDLAGKVAAEEKILKRYTWILVARKILTQTDENHVAHTEISKLYRRDGPASTAFTFYYDEILPGIMKLPQYHAHYGRREPVMQNHTPFSFGHEQPDKTVWEIAHQDPRRLKRAMDTMDICQDGPTIAGVYDFGWVSDVVAKEGDASRVLFVDVGSGKGHVTKAILEQNKFIPRERTVLQDREDVMEQVASLRDPGLTGVRLQSHDFHDEQPIKNALIYFVCRCLHNYSDEVATKMLTHLGNAMASDSRILIAEIAMSDPPSAFQSAHDMTMVALGGKERTVKDWAELAGRAGLAVKETHGLNSDAWIHVIECVRA
ncbi:Methyltransferase fsa4 [Colletotrichum spinosum]|uniref:Methyltransferase fsa4 n=1 Tax=Colletotrichum spinosum TaxID=1347390 RepID=A0A4R8QIW5_9PEZI|nr:Methyltransferase fsa4 [Colletotrichum spinosum]